MPVPMVFPGKTNIVFKLIYLFHTPSSSKCLHSPFRCGKFYISGTDFISFFSIYDTGLFFGLFFSLNTNKVSETSTLLKRNKW